MEIMADSYTNSIQDEADDLQNLPFDQTALKLMQLDINNNNNYFDLNNADIDHQMQIEDLQYTTDVGQTNNYQNQDLLQNNTNETTNTTLDATIAP